MMVGARAALALKLGAGAVATVAAVGLGLVFWPGVKSDHVAGKAAVEQPVFIVASPLKSSSAAPPPPAITASPVAAPPSDKAGLAQLASALKTQAPKPNAPSTPAAVPTPTQVAAVAPQATPNAAAPSQVAPAAVQAAPKAAPPTANREAEGCFGHGLVALAKGDIAGARRWLQLAADEGENRALMVLGDAYNPAMLTRLGVIGAPGDPALARDYYNRAVAAGLAGARDRLASLDTAN